MLQARRIAKQSGEAADAQRVYLASYPASERVPFWLLMAKTKKWGVDFTGYYDGDEFVGYTYVITRNDLTLLFYLAVSPHLHSRGYGSQILTQLRQRYPGRIILDIEQPDDHAENNAQRLRRRAFYFKNGYRSTGIAVKEQHMTYERLILNGTCTLEECRLLDRELTGWFYYVFYHAKLDYLPG